MVTQIFDTNDRRTLIRSVHAILKENGWSVDHVPNHRRLDFNIRKQDADLSLKFLDGSDLIYKSLDTLLDDMTVEGKSLFGIEARHIVWIYGNHFLDPVRESIIRRDLIVIDANAVMTLDEICDAEKINVENMDSIRLKLLKRSVKSCVKIAARYEQDGDFATAVEWLHAGTQATLTFSAAHRQLFYTLIKAKRKEEAYALGRDLLSSRPEARSLTSAMETLANALGRKQDAARWKALQEPAGQESVQPKDFETLVSKMATSNSRWNVQKEVPRAVRAGQTFFANLRRKLFNEPR